MKRCEFKRRVGISQATAVVAEGRNFTPTKCYAPRWLRQRRKLVAKTHFCTEPCKEFF